jgi:hypothetical protein
LSRPPEERAAKFFEGRHEKILALCRDGCSSGDIRRCQTVNAGKYTVEGTNLDGFSYSGTAEITLASESTCVMEWETAGVKSSGVCMLNGNAFAAAYVLRRPRPGRLQSQR